jgi:hypothetical protein
MRVAAVVLIFLLVFGVIGVKKYNNYKEQKREKIVLDSIQNYSDNQRKNIKVLEIGLPARDEGADSIGNASHKTK